MKAAGNRNLRPLWPIVGNAAPAIEIDDDVLDVLDDFVRALAKRRVALEMQVAANDNVVPEGR